MKNYVERAKRTWTPSDDNVADISYLSLSLAGEAGEVANIVKKVWRHGRELNPAEIADELGDVLWYLAILSDAIGYSLDDLAELNVYKLEKRHMISPTDKCATCTHERRWHDSDGCHNACYCEKFVPLE